MILSALKDTRLTSLTLGQQFRDRLDPGLDRSGNPATLLDRERDRFLARPIELDQVFTSIR